MPSEPVSPKLPQRQLSESAVPDSPIQRPLTPADANLPDSSQATLPSTEIPQSPIEPNQSFKTEVNDDRPAVTVIPSSLTPPPSTQVNNHTLNGTSKRPLSASQQSTLFSPPATVLSTLRERQLSSDYVAPTPQQVQDASADELRAMLQTCIAENQKLKMETAHHKLQYNLLSLQADEDSKRAEVEHDMVRREVDALRSAEHTRQAKRELSTSSESTQAKYLQMKMWYESASDEVQTLQRRVKLAKKVIQQKEEETIGLSEERDILLNRIRENREHLHSMCSPGGIFHGVMSPKQPNHLSTPVQHRSHARQTPRSTTREAREGEHGLSALLQAMSQDNNSAPSTPLQSHRPAPRHGAKHHRNAQSMSSLPTTPMNRPRGEHSGLLPSVDLVPQTEPQRYSQRHRPSTPGEKTERRRKSRESTISVDDNAELARQALESVAAAQSFTSQRSTASRSRRHGDEEDEEVFDSQASQAATEMLRRDPRQSFEVASSTGSRDATPGPVEKSARMQAKIFASNVKVDADKRKFSGNHASGEEVRREQGSPSKKMRIGGPLLDERRKVGLGIQYSQ